MIEVAAIDHVVLVVRDLAASLRFYQDVLGMRRIDFGTGRTAVGFGRQKINLQPFDAQSPPVARRPEPGAADLCLLLSTSLEAAIEHLRRCGVPVVEGPAEKSGATGPILSVYVRDPDGNLVELSVPGEAWSATGRPADRSG